MTHATGGYSRRFGGDVLKRCGQRTTVAYLENRQGGQPQEGAHCYLKGATRYQRKIFVDFFLENT